MHLSNIEKSVKRRMRFSVRTMLLLLTLATILIVLTQWVISHRYSKAMDILVEEINTDLATHYDQSIGDSRILLTSERVANCINSNDHLVSQAPPRYASVFRKIAKSRRIPNYVDFDVKPMTSFSDGIPRRCWSMRITINDGTKQYSTTFEESAGSE